jgi:hypothetical protein
MALWREAAAYGRPREAVFCLRGKEVQQREQMVGRPKGKGAQKLACPRGVIQFQC